MERCFVIQSIRRVEGYIFDGPPSNRWQEVELQPYPATPAPPRPRPAPKPKPTPRAAPHPTLPRVLPHRPIPPRAPHVLDWAKRMSNWAFEAAPEGCIPKPKRRRSKGFTHSQANAMAWGHRLIASTINPTRTKPVNAVRSNPFV